MREEISSIGERLIKKLSKLLSSERSSVQLLQTYVRARPQLVDDKLDELGIAGAEKEVAKIFAEIEIPKLIKASGKEVAAFARVFLLPLIPMIADLAKKSHLEALSTDFREVQRTESHREFTFRVVRSNAANLILPDTGVVFLLPSRVAPISSKKDRVSDIIVPLSSQLYIHGFKRIQKIRDRKVLLRILASCAYRSFIANENSDEFLQLSNRVGENAKIVSDSDLDRIISFRSLSKSFGEKPSAD